MTSADEVIYLDYAATTPVDPAVAAVMAQCLTEDGAFANAASVTHAPGRAARRRVETARAQVAAAVGAQAEQVVWTSGATEANNLAIAGAARFRRDDGRHIVTCRTEHRAVLDVCRRLEHEGWSVTYLVPGPDGRLAPQAVADALRPDTQLVSVMHVNSEIGVVQDIAGIGAVCRAAGVAFHVDAAQSVGKQPVDLSVLPVDFMSFSAHKAYGPKGVGALYVANARAPGLEPLLYGGGQERGLRPGTLPTHQVAGMGEAFRLAAERLAGDRQHIGALRQRLLDGLGALEGWSINGAAEHSVPGIVNICFEGVEGESLLHELRPLAVSRGSACSAASPESSYVLRALGRPDHLAGSSVRFSLGRGTTAQQVDAAVAVVLRAVARLRTLAVGLALPAAGRTVA